MVAKVDQKDDKTSQNQNANPLDLKEPRTNSEPEDAEKSPSQAAPIDGETLPPTNAKEVAPTDGQIVTEPDETLDLDAEGEGEPPPSKPPETLPYDPVKDRENVRGKIAISLIEILAAIILLSFILLAFQPDSSDKLKEILSLVFGPLVALVGAATGYYFGAKSSGKD